MKEEGAPIALTGRIFGGQADRPSLGVWLNHDPGDFESRLLRRRADLGRWTPHELRHSAASIMLAQGTAPWVVAELLHASVAITKDVYGHLIVRPAPPEGT